MPTRLLLFILYFCILLYLRPLFADIKIPDISFYGKEITNYYVGPSFASINLKYDKKTDFDTYLKKINIEAESLKESKYTSEKPGLMFSGKFLTNFSSLFVGDKAFRNYIVKKFLERDYFAVISGFENYGDKLQDTEYYNEVKFLYAFSLKMTGNTNQALNYLEDLSKNNDEFSLYSQDVLFSYLYDIHDYDRILSVKEDIVRFSPFSEYIVLKVLLDRNRFDEIIELVDKNTQNISKNNIFNKFKIIAYYYKKEYKTLLDYIDIADNESIFFIIDAAINIGKMELAKNLIVNLSDSEMINYFNGRIAIAGNNVTKLERSINRLQEDRNKLNLVFLYLDKYYPEIDLAFMDSVNFKDRSYKDYIYFYSGLYLLEKNDYLSASTFLQRIAFNPALVSNSYFYLGYAYANQDMDRAIYYLTRYLNMESAHGEKLAVAKYLLGNIYFIKNDINKTLIVISDCKEDFCLDLKARTYISKKDYTKMLKIIDGLEPDKRAYYRAVYYYNTKKYDKSLQMLKNIEKPTAESDKLLMLTFFKLDKKDSALEIFRKYRELSDFRKEAVKYLFLSGDYKMVIDISNKDDDPYIKLIRAKSLYSLKEYNRALSIFNELLTYEKYRYDVIFSIINIYDRLYKDKEYIEKSLSLIKRYNFDNKDLLVLRLINRSLDDNVNFTIGLINYFLDNFKNSEYLNDVYLGRAKLFNKIGKNDECIVDTNYVLDIAPKNIDALFIQATCYEATEKFESAVDNYKKLIELNNNPYTEISYKKLIEYSNDKDIVYEACNYFKEKNDRLYTKGMIRYLDLVNMEELPKHVDFITKLKKYKDPDIAAAGYYIFGKLLEGKNDLKTAASNYLNGYYLKESSEFSKKALERAYNIYKNLNDLDNAKKVKKLMKGGKND
ncbi:MAG: tetratricopeptide repeat protein [Deferribacterota bacterium]|nr:tetratricopeptide repeat protein [Deferribacterota bacterium]